MPYLNSSRYHLERVLRAFAADVRPGARLLDAGAGDQVYRRVFSHCDYEAADFEKVDKPYARSTYVCDLASIPVEDGRFDHVVFTQTLEHLPEPMAVLRELRRVLKPGGQMICTVPLYYPEHEVPYDFYRYTQFALARVFPQAGFRVERIEWLEGYLGTVAFQLRQMSRALPWGPSGASPVAILGWPLVLATKLAAGLFMNVFAVIDRRHRLVGRGHPKNYVVIAEAV